MRGIAHLGACCTCNGVGHIMLGFDNYNGVRIAAGASIFHFALCRAGSLFGDCALSEGVSDGCGIVASIGLAAMRAGVNGIAYLGMSRCDCLGLPIMTARDDVADMRCSAMLAGMDSIACLVACGRNYSVFIRMLECGNSGEITVCATGLAFILNYARVCAGRFEDNIALHSMAGRGSRVGFGINESAMFAGVDSVARLSAGGSNDGIFIRMLECGSGGKIAICAAGLAFILNYASVCAGGFEDNIALHVVAGRGDHGRFGMNESAALAIVFVCQAVGGAGRSIAFDYRMSVLACRADILLLDDDFAAAIAVRALGLAIGAAGGRNGRILDLVVSELGNSRCVLFESAVDADKLARAILGAGRCNELLDECMICVNGYIKRSGSAVLKFDLERMFACRERPADKLECLVREMPVSCERIVFTHRIVSIACV